MLTSSEELLAPLRDLEDCGKEIRGRFLAAGASTPLSKESATTALRDEESGDINGPGVSRAMERLERLVGRIGVVGLDCWAPGGKSGAEAAFPRACGLIRLSSDCHGLCNRGDAVFSLRVVVLDDVDDV